MSAARVASRALCSESASVNFRPVAVRRSMADAGPTVLTITCRGPMPASSRKMSSAAATACRFCVGSPDPMKTMRSTEPRRRRCTTCSRISETVRLRATLSRPDAQKRQAIAQPTCDEMQAEPAAVRAGRSAVSRWGGALAPGR